MAHAHRLLTQNYSQRILTYYTCILLLDLTYGRTMTTTIQPRLSARLEVSTSKQTNSVHYQNCLLTQKLSLAQYATVTCDSCTQLLLQAITDGQSNLTKGRIAAAAAHARFKVIRRVAPVCIPPNTRFLGPARVQILNGISISSDVLAQLTADSSYTLQRAVPPP